MSLAADGALRETYRSSAKKMLSVPRVTMNGGSRRRVMSQPVEAPAGECRRERRRRGRAARARPISTESFAITSDAEHHDRAHRQVHAGGQDDDRLADGQGAHDHHLLDDQRQVRDRSGTGRRRRARSSRTSPRARCSGTEGRMVVQDHAERAGRGPGAAALVDSDRVRRMPRRRRLSAVVSGLCHRSSRACERPGSHGCEG